MTRARYERRHVLPIAIGITAAPIYHHLLHRYHLADGDG